LNACIQKIQTLGMPDRLSFELLDVGLHIDRGRGAQGFQKAGDLGKTVVRFLR
jgi:hypothetical protein